MNLIFSVFLFETPGVHLSPSPPLPSPPPPPLSSPPLPFPLLFPPPPLTRKSISQIYELKETSCLIANGFYLG